MRKHILYLASGNSSRFGENKLLHPWQGKPLFLWGLETLEALTQDRRDCTLTVVSRYEAIRQTAREKGIRAVDCPESRQGVSYTIRAGIQALGEIPGEDCLLFVVADQPRLRGASVERLLSAADRGVKAASLCWGSQPGNPTLFSAALVPELLALEGDRGGRKILNRHGCVWIPAEAAEELADIDTAADL